MKSLPSKTNGYNALLFFSLRTDEYQRLSKACRCRQPYTFENVSKNIQAPNISKLKVLNHHPPPPPPDKMVKKLRPTPLLQSLLEIRMCYKGFLFLKGRRRRRRRPKTHPISTSQCTNKTKLTCTFCNNTTVVDIAIWL